MDNLKYKVMEFKLSEESRKETINALSGFISTFIDLNPLLDQIESIIAAQIGEVGDEAIKKMAFDLYKRPLGKDYDTDIVKYNTRIGWIIGAKWMRSLILNGKE